MGLESNPRVAVVGAGLAGLGAAWRLARAGCEIVLLEREARAGGRNLGTSAAGFALDGRVTLVRAADRNLLGWIAELGLGDTFLPVRAVELAQVRRGRAVAIGPRGLTGVARLSGMNPFDWGRLPRFERLMNRYRPFLNPEVPERAARLDSRSAADFGRLYFGDNLFERWIAPTLTNAYLSDEHQLSRVAFLLEWLAGWESAEPPGLLRAGLYGVAESAAAALNVHLGSQVESVEAGSAGGYRVHWCARSHGPAGGGSGAMEGVEVDAVVIATAAHAAGRIAASLVTPAERDFLAGVCYSPTVTLSVALERPLAEVPRHVRIPRADACPVEQYVVEPGRGEGRAPAGRGLMTLTATEPFALVSANLADEVATKALLAPMERLYPRLRALLRFARLTRFDEAVPRFHVGAYRALERFQRVQVDRRSLGRRLYFAADHLCGPRPESALSSGFRAARALLADFR